MNFVSDTRVPRKIVFALSIGVTYGFLLAVMFLNHTVEVDQVIIKQTKEINSKPAKPSESTTTIEPLQKLAFAKTHKTGGK